VLPLKNIEDTFNGFSSTRIKRHINKANKDLSIITKETDDIELIIYLSQLTFQRQEMSLTIYDVLRTLNQFNNSKSYISFQEETDRAIAGCYIVYDKKRAYYICGGYDHKYKNHFAMIKCFWESIKAAYELNLVEYDFEGTMLKNVEPIFRSFGGNMLPVVNITKNIPLYYLYRLLSKYRILKY
jgi:lipid II:glycine glycyltransferase (peptidoglycan interpeptide bridge formation enzyme)